MEKKNKSSTSSKGIPQMIVRQNKFTLTYQQFHIINQKLPSNYLLVKVSDLHTYHNVKQVKKPIYQCQSENSSPLQSSQPIFQSSIAQLLHQLNQIKQQSLNHQFPKLKPKKRKAGLIMEIFKLAFKRQPKKKFKMLSAYIQVTRLEGVIKTILNQYEEGVISVSQFKKRMLLILETLKDNVEISKKEDQQLIRVIQEIIDDLYEICERTSVDQLNSQIMSLQKTLSQVNVAKQKEIAQKLNDENIEEEKMIDLGQKINQLPDIEKVEVWEIINGMPFAKNNQLRVKSYKLKQICGQKWHKLQKWWENKEKQRVKQQKDQKRRKLLKEMNEKMYRIKE